MCGVIDAARVLPEDLGNGFSSLPDGVFYNIVRKERTETERGLPACAGGNFGTNKQRDGLETSSQVKQR